MQHSDIDLWALSGFLQLCRALQEKESQKKDQICWKKEQKEPTRKLKKKQKTQNKPVCALRADRHHSRFIVVKPCCCHDNMGSTSAYQVIAN